MKTSKKVLSILLAVLMLAGCLSVAFSASAATIYKKILLTCPTPVAGGAFPTKADVSYEIMSLNLDRIDIYEKTSETTSVKATAPFEAGKTYEITFAMRTLSGTDSFSSTNLTAKVNGESCNAVYLTRTTANVVWTVTVEDASVTVTFRRGAVGTDIIESFGFLLNGDLVEGGNHSFSVEVAPGTSLTIECFYSGDYAFVGWRSDANSEVLVANTLKYTFVANRNMTLQPKLIKFNSREAVELKKASDNMFDGDYYLNMDMLAEKLVNKFGYGSNIAEIKAQLAQMRVWWYCNNEEDNDVFMIVRNNPVTGARETEYLTSYGIDTSSMNDETNFALYKDFKSCMEQYFSEAALDPANYIRLKITGTLHPNLDDPLQEGDWYFDWYAYGRAWGYDLDDPDVYDYYYDSFDESSDYHTYKFNPLNEFVMINASNDSVVVLTPVDPYYRTHYNCARIAIKQYWNPSLYILLKDPDAETLQNGDWYFDYDAFAKAFFETNNMEGVVGKWEDLTPEQKDAWLAACKSYKVWYRSDNGTIRVSRINDQVLKSGDEGYEDYAPYIKQYRAPTQPDNPGDNGNNNQNANRCHWCGKDHNGNFFQKIIAFFHNILAKIFGNKY